MQLLAEELVGVRVQVLEGVNLPELLLLNETEPVGLVGVGVVSVTFAVQWAAWSTATEPGLQVTMVLVA